MTQQLYIVAANKKTDGHGHLQQTQSLHRKAKDLNFKIKEYHIASFSLGWNTTLPATHFKSACSPLEVLLKTQSLFQNSEADIVFLKGKDFIKSDFKNNKAARQKLMEVYGTTTILEAYDQVADSFFKDFQLSQDTFDDICEMLFENYWQTWIQKHPEATHPHEKWLQKVSKNFRGVDCANPNTDFAGEICICTEESANALAIPDDERIQVSGVSLVKRCSDSLANIPKFTDYGHITEAFDQACEQARIDFHNVFQQGKALLEVYTCYPIVPIAFLLRAGFVKNFDDMPSFLKTHHITFTGGLNLNKAPWNNTTLSAIIDAFELLKTQTTNVIGIHSNGAIGNQQGFLILT